MSDQLGRLRVRRRSPQASSPRRPRSCGQFRRPLHGHHARLLTARPPRPRSSRAFERKKAGCRRARDVVARRNVLDGPRAARIRSREQRGRFAYTEAHANRSKCNRRPRKRVACVVRHVAADCRRRPGIPNVARHRRAAFVVMRTRGVRAVANLPRDRTANRREHDRHRNEDLPHTRPDPTADACGRDSSWEQSVRRWASAGPICTRLTRSPSVVRGGRETCSSPPADLVDHRSRGRYSAASASALAIIFSIGLPQPAPNRRLPWCGLPSTFRRSYLQYAACSSVGDVAGARAALLATTGDKAVREVPNPVVADIARALRARGWEVAEGLGASRLR